MPSAAMVALLAVNSGQLYDDWNTATSRENSVVVHDGAVPSLGIYYDLQQERQLSAATLADPAAYRAKLAAARKATDSSATALKSLSGGMPANIDAILLRLDGQLQQLAVYRAAVDNGTATQQQAYDDYTALVSSDESLFTALSQTGVAAIDVKTEPNMFPAWGEEMISREDAIITAGAVSGHLTGGQRAQIEQAVGSQQYIYQDEVIPSFPASISGLYQGMLAGRVWQQKTQVEQGLLDAPVSPTTGDSAVPAALGQQWRQVTAALDPQLQQLTGAETGYILSSGNSVLNSLKTRLIVQSLLGVAGVILAGGLTSWLVGMLRRRILTLRVAASQLETRLPEVVERLRRGEAVDIDAELPELHYHGGDELGMLGRALNAARGSALETSVRQVEQYRGFERLLQRIARRTQLLIGLQMKRLSEMERQYDDSELLEGLFDLDHLTARLRRYEENLVILGGGQPQRRWRKPVPLLNVLRSAQGEVQDYRRIRVEMHSRVWIAERAVGALVHMLAELMENAVAFSKPPTPVEVSAAPVTHGLAIEIEDRGMGMDAGQYAEANALMAAPPRMDVLSRADDARLGLYVVARLSANLGVKVELRPSSFGGTRVVVLVPADLVLTEEQLPPSAAAPSAQDEDDIELAPRLAAVTAGAADGVDLDAAAVDAAFVDAGAVNGARADAPAPAPAPAVAVAGAVGNGALHGGTERVELHGRLEHLLTRVGGRSPDPAGTPRLEPLPRRVRQANLAAELREARGEGAEAAPKGAAAEPDPRTERPGRSVATIGAFQRQSRRARLAADGEPFPPRPASSGEQTTEEGGR
ncbi:MAG TPA: nitrate- and nitrite sensing domain-containing protein [Actinospica sp.]|nr:nitrate- and nitrite sensing domain-containing protein [Actinospica sp.]